VLGTLCNSSIAAAPASATPASTVAAVTALADPEPAACDGGGGGAGGDSRRQASITSAIATQRRDIAAILPDAARTECWIAPIVVDRATARGKRRAGDEAGCARDACHATIVASQRIRSQIRRMMMAEKSSLEGGGRSGSNFAATLASTGSAATRAAASSASIAAHSALSHGCGG
jgi:hypothetical protein